MRFYKQGIWARAAAAAVQLSETQLLSTARQFWLLCGSCACRQPSRGRTQANQMFIDLQRTKLPRDSSCWVTADLAPAAMQQRLPCSWTPAIAAAAAADWGNIERDLGAEAATLWALKRQPPSPLRSAVHTNTHHFVLKVWMLQAAMGPKREGSTAPGQPAAPTTSHLCASCCA